MTAYLILFVEEIVDPDEMAEYGRKARGIKGAGAVPLVVYGAKSVMEGPDFEGVAMLSFPSMEEGCEHGCATCKPAAMVRLIESPGPTIFVGDGLSDRYAAACADLVFAKNDLAAYCDEHAITYRRFDTLALVTQTISDLAERRFQSV